MQQHGALINQFISDLKAALRDAVDRRARALQIVTTSEAAVASKLAEVASLQAQVAAASSAQASSEGALAQARARIQQLEADMAVAQDNEAAANREIDEAADAIQALEARLRELEAESAGLRQAVADGEAINEGLEDDKAELRARVADLTAQLSNTATGAEESVKRTRAEAASAAAAAAARIEALQAEAARLTEEARAASRRIQELERAAAASEVELARTRLERDAAVESKASLVRDLEHLRKQQEVSNASLNETMTTFHKSQAQLQAREEFMMTTLSKHQESIAALTAERDALVRAETGLRADLRDAATREARLSADLEAARAHCASLQGELAAAREAAAAVSAQLAATTAAKEELEAKLESTTAKLQGAEAKLAVAAEERVAADAREKALKASVEELTTARAAAEDTIGALNQELSTLKESAGATRDSQLDKLCTLSKEAEGMRRQMRRIPELLAKLEAAEAAVSHLREELFSGEMSRRALHNHIQELKGNIRVFVRVRPFLPGDTNAVEDEEGGAGGDAGGALIPAIHCSPDGSSLDITPPIPRGTKDTSLLGVARKPPPPQRFSFDAVLGPRTTQADVFNEVCHLVQSALDGYNVCLFSYGQTGSGKTHTMQGGPGPEAGLIPRSIRMIAETAGRMQGQGWAYTLEASFLEIYNESIRDLLRVGGAEEPAAPLSIHQDAEGAPEVPGLTRVPVACPGDIDALLARAAKRRAVACTAMNEQSSRSHQVFTLYIRGEHDGKGVSVLGTLNLCDLAGSERLSRSLAEGDRKKETAAINKSLSCLADVFTALAKKAPHVPFRNSKLTHLLSPCFKGDGKTLMLVNLSPTLGSAQESLCSLRFAAQVSQVELGKAKKKVVENGGAEGEAAASQAAATGAGRGSLAPSAASSRRLPGVAAPLPAASSAAAAPRKLGPVSGAAAVSSRSLAGVARSGGAPAAASSARPATASQLRGFTEEAEDATGASSYMAYGDEEGMVSGGGIDILGFSEGEGSDGGEGEGHDSSLALGDLDGIPGSDAEDDDELEAENDMQPLSFAASTTARVATTAAAAAPPPAVPPRRLSGSKRTFAAMSASSSTAASSSSSSRAVSGSGRTPAPLGASTSSRALLSESTASSRKLLGSSQSGGGAATGGHYGSLVTQSGGSRLGGGAAGAGRPIEPASKRPKFGL